MDQEPKPPSPSPRRSRRVLWVAFGFIVLVGTVLVLSSSFGAGADARFRMTVTEARPADNIVTGSITHIDKEGRPSVTSGGRRYTVRVNPKRVFREDERGTLGRVTVESIGVNDRIRVVGRLRDDGSIDGKKIVIQ